MMDIKIKNYLGIAGIVVMVAFAYGALQFASVAEPSLSRSFTVGGEGKVTAIPDVAVFSFSILTEGGTDLSSSQEKNTTASNKAIAFVKENGVDNKDISTQGYSINPRYQYANCGGPLLNGASVCPPPEIVGYTISQSVQVKIRDFKNIGTIMRGVVSNGANTVSGLSFDIDDRTKLENDARAKAIAAAEERAKTIAKAGHFRMGKIISINDGGVSVPMPYRTFGAVSESAMGAKTIPTIEPGSQDISANISITYSVK
ncbi:MAG: SIMPL domain-containing protein [Candidatus Lloydbacteria bacterium]|nr:SIMPL domain-containing protein [Candidatus Lloydbacteria bacterium]